MLELPLDVQLLRKDLASNREQAISLLASLQDPQASPLEPGKWDAAQHFEHLALFNEAYLVAMKAAAEKGRQTAQHRRQAVRPGWRAKLLLLMIEPPIRAWTRAKSPGAAKPEGRSLANSFQAFLESHDAAASFHADNWELDLARIRFKNPFAKGLNFSLATCLYLLAAHERRHFWLMNRSIGGS